MQKEDVRIETKKLQQLGYSLAVILPAKWLRKFHLNRSDEIDLVITDNVILVIDQNVDFDADILKGDLSLAQKVWDAKEKLDQLRWFKKLSPEKRAKIQKAVKKADKELDECKGELI